MMLAWKQTSGASPTETELRNYARPHPAKIDIFPFAAKVRPQCSSEMNLEKFFTELKRRNVYKVAVAYAVVAWLLIQIATQVFPFFEIPNWTVRLVVLLIIIGFPIALVIAWAFELTPEGLKRTEVAMPLPRHHHEVARGFTWF